MGSKYHTNGQNNPGNEHDSALIHPADDTGIAVGDVFTRYKAFFENTLDIVLFISTDGRILDANRSACIAYGYSHNELLKLRSSDIDADSTSA